jgi:hypothetical protein
MIPSQHGFNIFAWLLRPKSRGEVRLRSADPFDRPAIEPRFFSAIEDARAIVEGIRVARKLMKTEPFAPLVDGEVFPGENISSNDALLDYVHRNSGTIYHPVGSCKMGPKSDRMAVVDAQLQVHDIKGLRIADTSIMPNIISGNTNAPAMMIGERAAEFVRKAARTNAQIFCPRSHCLSHDELFSKSMPRNIENRRRQEFSRQLPGRYSSRDLARDRLPEKPVVSQKIDRVPVSAHDAMVALKWRNIGAD